MRVVILTQQDRFFIPKNIEKTMEVAEILEIVNLDCKSSLNNKFSDFIRWFGISQSLKLGIKYLLRTAEGEIDKISRFKIYGGYCSIKHIALKHKIPYRTIKNVNSEDFFEHIEELNPDLIISFSAPQVIKEPLLSYPKHGIINVHGSLLPDYRGCLPSFWYLYNKEKFAGATVHYMSAKIDDGKIIMQSKISIAHCTSMFEVMQATKKLGGELMLQSMKQISNNSVHAKPNISSEGRYFSWPTKEQARKLLKSGKCLI